jgi:two-component system, chemotaxis family, protein-glutamate methylesterase/glutaminase
MVRSSDFERERCGLDAVASGEPLPAFARGGAGVIVIGASAGGVKALRAVVGGLAPELPAVVLVVLHISPHSPSALPRILDRAGPLPAVAAEHGMPAAPGVIYVAPADRHLLLHDGHLELSVGPIENGHRPAIDPLFRSAAAAYGAGAIGVVLSGARDDGTAGLAAIVERGGQAVVQDPNEALNRSMPASALEHVPTAHVLPAAKIGALLGELVGEGAPPLHRLGEPDGQLAAENKIAMFEAMTTETVLSRRPSGFACPSCHGVLFELDGEPAPRYRCRVGHAWSPKSLVAEMSIEADEALWVALRTLEENTAINFRLAETAEQREQHRAAALYRQRYESSKVAARQLRALISRVSFAPTGPIEDE